MKISFASPKSVSDGYCSSGSAKWRLLTLAAGVQAPNDLLVLLQPGELDDHVGDLALAVSMWWQSTEDTCDDAHAITPDYSLIG